MVRAKPKGSTPVVFFLGGGLGLISGIITISMFYINSYNILFFIGTQKGKPPVWKGAGPKSKIFTILKLSVTQEVYEEAPELSYQFDTELSSTKVTMGTAAAWPPLPPVFGETPAESLGEPGFRGGFGLSWLGLLGGSGCGREGQANSGVPRGSNYINLPSTKARVQMFKSPNHQSKPPISQGLGKEGFLNLCWAWFSFETCERQRSNSGKRSRAERAARAPWEDGTRGTPVLFSPVRFSFPIGANQVTLSWWFGLVVGRLEHLNPGLCRG